jgi:REP element-mobilizing transposase RayT
MPWSLKRYYGAGDLHFITCSCYRRRPWLASARRRDLFLEILEQTRQRYGFVVVGYVVMPEHFHLLISEPEKGTPSTVLQVLKQRVARRVLRERRRRRASGQGLLWRSSKTCTSGKRASTISTSGASASGLRSCATCIAIRWSAGWCPNPSNGAGAASVATLSARKEE